LSVAPEIRGDVIVRLDPWVVYRHLRTKRQRRVGVVGPGSENSEENEVSLLSSIGAGVFPL
jgi:transcription elongation GreA/GreB family factor